MIYGSSAITGSPFCGWVMVRFGMMANVALEVSFTLELEASSISISASLETTVLLPMVQLKDWSGAVTFSAFGTRVHELPLFRVYLMWTLEMDEDCQVIS